MKMDFLKYSSCLSALAAMLFAVSCSDSDPSPAPAPPPAPTPPPANSAPTFTSPAAASSAENASGTVYTASASDADGDTLSFSISGGADQGDFVIDANSGALSFATAPDFENPGDADNDNIYVVEIQVSDGSLTTTLTVSITITDVDPEIQVRRVATGFSQPLYLTGLTDGSGRVYVVEREGVIHILDPETGDISNTPFADLTGVVVVTGEGGLLGFALAPDFATSGEYYVHSTNAAGDSELRRFSVLAGDPERTDPASGDIILTVPQSADNHKGAWIDFGADGFLYIAIGDSGGSDDPLDFAQDIDELEGKILRIDVTGDDFPGDAGRDYAIPADNPFVGVAGADEIWHLGLRNPYRNSFDRATGDLYIGDVGQGRIEEIDFQPAGVGGLNYGWVDLEGTLDNLGTNQPNFTPPVLQYEHGADPFGAFEGRSVTGGYVYRGPLTDFVGQYIFGDFISGNLWSVPVSSLSQGATVEAGDPDFVSRTADFAPDFGEINAISSFGEDAAGNLYILDFDGEIFRLESAN